MNKKNTYWARLNEDWRVAVKKIAPDHDVDADKLLRKVQNLFIDDAPNRQQADAFVREFLLRTDEMTVAERKVCMRAALFVQETIREEIERVRPELGAL